MTDKDEDVSNDFDWKKTLYGDALSERTEKTGRMLLLVALTTLSVSVFDVSIKTLPGTAIDFSNQPAALEMFLATINLGLIVAYGLRVSADFLRAREEGANLIRFFATRAADDAWRRARAVDESIADQERDYDPDPDPWYERAIEIQEKESERIEEVEAKFGNRRLPKTIRHIRLWALGGAPLTIGLLALIHSGAAVREFALAIADLSG